jgi:hypothetical protein
MRVGAISDEKVMAKQASAAKSATRGPVSLKITLRAIKPPIWRRILVPRGMTLGDLHIAIQVVMGWQNGHLHAFEVAGERYGQRGSLEDVSDEDRLTLGGLVRSGVSRFRYTYDFGDDWEHDVLIEKIPPKLPRVTAFPACVAGKRNCPPEDCGGPFGYEDLLVILNDPNHPEHEERSEWIREEFDPEAFSAGAADATLGEVFRRKTA